jgi:hypothetical protein
MKLLIIVACCLAAGSAAAQNYHRGYTTNNGTYVPPHYQSTPDRSYNNNWSVSPNTNPYTGQMGTRAPTWNDRPPTSSYGNSRRW